MKSLRFAALAAALVLGACSTSSPTDPATSASHPSFDGGGMVGSGNGVGTGSTEDGGNTLGSGNRTESGDSTGRGGNMIGSGN